MPPKGGRDTYRKAPLGPSRAKRRVHQFRLAKTAWHTLNNQPGSPGLAAQAGLGPAFMPGDQECKTDTAVPFTGLSPQSACARRYWLKPGGEKSRERDSVRTPVLLLPAVNGGPNTACAGKPRERDSSIGMSPNPETRDLSRRVFRAPRSSLGQATLVLRRTGRAFQGRTAVGRGFRAQ